MAATAGRPKRASQELLQEAAFELFQHRGYRGTTVEQIARTAGFSRATFFNCFASKAELFWLEVDALIASLRAHLEAQLATEARPSLREALLGFAVTFESSRIPWALQNYRLLEAAEDLAASGAGRVLELNRAFVRYLQETEKLAAIELHARAAATTATLVSGLLGWIDAGVTRGPFGDHLGRALIH